MEKSKSQKDHFNSTFDGRNTQQITIYFFVVCLLVCLRGSKAFPIVFFIAEFQELILTFLLPYSTGNLREAPVKHGTGSPTALVSFNQQIYFISRCMRVGINMLFQLAFET